LNEAWEQEANTLRLANRLGHDHIITCLAAVRRGDRRFFIFPWADGGTLREIWDRIPQPNLRPGLIQHCFRQLRGLADALVHMHNYKPKRTDKAQEMAFTGDEDEDLDFTQSEHSIRHGDLKPENILSFTSSTSELGLLKIADLAFAKQHVVATVFRHHTSTRFGTVRYEAPETVTKLYGRSRLYDIWSMGCIILEMIIWLLYGIKGLEDFDNDFDTETPGTGTFYEAYTSSMRSETTIHRVVSKWMAFIERSDPECIEDSAIRDLLILVREKLLVVALPLPSTTNTPKTLTLTTNIGASAIIITPPATTTPDTMVPRYRATARQFRDYLDNCLAMNDVSSGYWLTRPDRTDVGRPPRSVSVHGMSKTTSTSPRIAS
jgi:serine/threonine protein kinase